MSSLFGLRFFVGSSRIALLLLVISSRSITFVDVSSDFGFFVFDDDVTGAVVVVVVVAVVVALDGGFKSTSVATVL